MTNSMSVSDEIFQSQMEHCWHVFFTQVMAATKLDLSQSSTCNQTR